MAHRPVVYQNNTLYSYEKDFSGVFDALPQSFFFLFFVIN